MYAHFLIKFFSINLNLCLESLFLCVRNGYKCQAFAYEEFLGKVIILKAAYVSPKFQHKPPHQWYLHIYADHPFPGHRCTLIPSQRLVFALFVDNSLDGVFGVCIFITYSEYSEYAS